MIALVLDLVADVVLPLAHDIAQPHQEPTTDSGGGTSPVLIVAIVAGTLVLAGGLIWVRERARRQDEASGPDASAGA